MAPHAVSQAAIFSPPTSPSGGAPSDAASTRGKAADSGSGGGAGAGAGSASKHKKAGPALDALRTNQAGRVTPTSTSSGSYAHANGSRIVPPLASPSGAAPMHTGFVTHTGGRDRVDSDDVDIVEDDFGTTPASAQWARTGPTQARPSRKTGSDTSGSIASTTAGAGGAGAGLSPMSSTMPLAKTVTNNPSASRSAYFARDFTVRVATSCGGHRGFTWGCVSGHRVRTWLVLASCGDCLVMHHATRRAVLSWRYRRSVWPYRGNAGCRSSVWTVYLAMSAGCGISRGCWSCDLCAGVRATGMC